MRAALAVVPILPRWWRRHRWTSGAALLLVVLGVAVGSTAGVATGAVGLVLPGAAMAVWERRSPASYERRARGPWRRLRWTVTVRRRWRSEIAEGCGIGFTQTRKRKGQVVKVFRPAKMRLHVGQYGVEMTVRTPLGLDADDVTAKVGPIAAAYEATSFAARWISPAEVRLRLTLTDPLAVVRVSEVTTGSDPVVLGYDASGDPVLFDVTEAAHTAIQGMTRSGKSVLTYGLLSGLAHREDVVVVGCDPSGLLLAPWAETSARGASLIALGTGDLAAHAAVLDALTDEMDRRIGVLRALRTDKLDAMTAELPAVVVVLEEYPGLLGAARLADRDLATRIERSVGRLVKESAKVGFRLLVLAQRMSAKAIDTDDRSNFGSRITLRVDSAEAVTMLHDRDAAPPIAQVQAWPPGIGLVQRIAVPAILWRACVTDYPTYLERVAAGIAATANAPALNMQVTSTVDELAPVFDKPRRPQPKRPRSAAA